MIPENQEAKSSNFLQIYTILLNRINDIINTIDATQAQNNPQAIAKCLDTLRNLEDKYNNYAKNI